MDEFIRVNVYDYVNDGIQNGILSLIKAEKFSRIIARKGMLGEEVISWSVDENGNELKERTSTVTIDDKTNEPGWIACKSDEYGNPILDSNNHLNEWIISDSVFKSKYEIEDSSLNLFKPKSKIQLFVQIPDSIIIEQWGKDMKISRGGYINITNSDDMYGISERDFNDTYRVVEEKNMII